MCLRALIFFSLRFINAIVLFALALAGGSATTLAQENLGLSELQSTTDRFLRNGNFAEARPYLMEIIDRFEGTPRETSLEAIYYYLGVANLATYAESEESQRLEEAISAFETLNQKFPNTDFAVRANLLLADAYRALSGGSEELLRKATAVYARLLNNPGRYRMESDDRQEALRKICETYYALQDWENGRSWFERLSQQARTDEGRALAATGLVEANLAAGDFQAVRDQLARVLGNNPSRYKVQFNAALLKAGDELVNEGNYSMAMLLYRTVLTPDELTVFQQARITRLENELQRVQRYARNPADDEVIYLETEIAKAKAQLEAIKQVDDYTVSLEARIARNFLQTGRIWEAFFAFRDLIELYPDHGSAENFHYAAFNAALQVRLVEEAIALGEEYLENDDYTRYSDQVSVSLIEFYKEAERYQDFYDAAIAYIRRSPDNRETQTFAMMLGQTYMENEDLNSLEATFSEFIDDFPGKRIEESAHFWVGVANLLRERYPEAEKNFSAIIEKFPNSVFYSDALYRRGIARYGQQEFRSAVSDFETVIAAYPEALTRGETEYFLADCYAALGEIDQALEHYYNVEKYSENPFYIKNAYVQAGTILEINQRYDAMEEHYKRFISNFSGKADAAFAFYQLGRAYQLQKFPHGTIAVFVDAIDQLANSQDSFEVDQILVEYPEIWLDAKGDLDATIAFIEDLKANRELRLKVSERSELFRELEKRPRVMERFKREMYDRSFRERIINNPSLLDSSLRTFKGYAEAVPEQRPEEFFLEKLETAKSNGQKTVELRMYFALDKLVDLYNKLGQRAASRGDSAEARDLASRVQRIENAYETPIFTDEDFANASPRVLVYLAAIVSEYDVAAARRALGRVIRRFPQADTALDAYLGLGQLEMQENNPEAGLAVFDEAARQYVARPDVWRAIMRKGDALRELNRFEQARDAYQRILRNRRWGSAHAEATYKIGQAYEDQGLTEEAAREYKGLFLAYRAFEQWASQGALRASRLFIGLGKTQEARSLINQYLQNPIGSAETEREIRQLSASL